MLTSQQELMNIKGQGLSLKRTWHFIGTNFLAARLDCGVNHLG